MKKEQRSATRDKLLELAKTNAVSVGHPVCLISLAVIYGHSGARKVFKPKLKYPDDEAKNKAAYNVVSDLIIISRVGQIATANANGNSQFSSIKYATFDRGLSDILKLMTLESREEISPGRFRMQIKYDPKLFPYLSREEALELMSLVRKKT